MKVIIEDAIIVKELQNKTANGNKLLFEKYYGALKKYLINNYSIECDNAEDIISDTLLSVIDNIGQFSFKDENSFRNWVYQIAKNKLIDIKRSAMENMVVYALDENIDFDGMISELSKLNSDINKMVLNEYLSNGITEDKRKELIYDTLKEFTAEEQSDLWAYFKGVNHIDSAKYRKITYSAYRKRISRLSIKFFNKIGSKLKIDGKIYNEKFKKII